MEGGQASLRAPLELGHGFAGCQSLLGMLLNSLVMGSYARGPTRLA
jgi:hypothetical protein